MCRTNESTKVQALCARSFGVLDQMESAIKKLVFFALLVGAYQNWDRIDHFVFVPPTNSSVESEVILYATEWCGYCQKTRELFQANNISYVEYDIEKSEKHAEEHRRLGGRGVPLLKINGYVIHGYRPQSILVAVNSD